VTSDAGTPPQERALTPPSRDRVEAPTWTCPQCGYSTPGTIDQPFAGDGTCPTHERQLLRLAAPGDSAAPR
jgi:hypothetical protein